MCIRGRGTQHPPGCCQAEDRIRNLVRSRGLGDVYKGQAFDLRMELLLGEDDSQSIKKTLAVALDGLANGEIGLGLRKRRGFGRCTVADWTVTNYNLKTPTGLLGWITEVHADWSRPAGRQAGKSIASLLSVATDDAPDKRRAFHLQATFLLDSSLLIRAGFGEQDQGPDTVHLHVRQAGQHAERSPVMSGTSLAGVLRHRASCIARTIVGDKPKAKEQVRDFLNNMFGPDEIKKGGRHVTASRDVVNEAVIKHAQELKKKRI